jgi:ATP-dependent Zn protease
MNPRRVADWSLALLSLDGFMTVLFAQAEPTPPPSRLAVTLLSWLPLILVVGLWLFFMRKLTGKGGRSAQYVSRSETHMAEVEAQLKRIVELLERRDRQ